MRKYKNVARLVVLCLSLMGKIENSQAQSAVERKYTVGDTYRYRLITEEFHNSTWKSTTIVINQLEVVADSAGVPYDKVQWISKQVVTDKDTSWQTEEATAVKPYLISLHPKGKLAIPKIEIPGMTGAIQDFATFFVAVSPHLGANALKAKGDSLNREDLVQGNFANGMNIVKGDDCFRVKIFLNELSTDRAVMTTSFLPPQKAGLSYLLEEMKVPVVNDTWNNFQMVMALGNGRFNVQYGKETFVITSSLKREDGRIESASMFNQLNLKLKVNCSAEYRDCQMELPFVITRKLSLQLL